MGGADQDTMLEVRLLGAFEVKRDGKPVSISSRPAQSLFAYLVLSAGTSHRREKLAGLLWPDSTEEGARDYLRHALWKIRKAIEPASAKGKSDSYIIADDIHVGFNPESKYLLDVAAIKNIGDDASTKDLMNALSLYEGELLPGYYEDWVLLEREHLQAVYEQKMARLLALLQEDGRWLDILKWGERWISLGQKPEPAYRALISAHAAQGDMSKVAATYERCVKSLKEFGIEPSEQTRALYERLKAGKEKLELGATVSLTQKRKESVSSPTNLPVPLTSFIGREKQVDEIVRLLGKNRLVTVTGPGGVGKTRLAIQSSNTLVNKFKDGVWWIDLVGLSDLSLVPQAIAKAVDVREVPNRPLMDTLAEQLQAKKILLVMDNCEHLIFACAQLADRLLSECKNLKILATSREALDILGETVWHAPSLSLPDMQEAIGIKSLSKYESVRLFTERAEVLQPQFMLTEQNAQSVVQICRRLSGMPLAIELAAARIKMMTVDEIAKRLDDRFDLLTSGNRTALPRQQTLRTTIDWSYDLLTEPERILFRRLSVFAGGFTLEAAEAVCGFGELKRGEVLDLLGRLVDKSLVDVEGISELSETRYRLLETIREYARLKVEEVGESKVLNEGHLEFFATFATLADKGIYGVQQAAWYKRLDQEIDNLRAAMNLPVSSIPENDPKRRSIQQNQFLIVGSVNVFWESRYRNEIIQALNKMLALDESNEPTIEKARAIGTGGFLFWALNRFSDARTYLEESIQMAERLGDQLTVAWSLSFLGWAFDFLGDYDGARNCLERSIAIAKSLGEDGKPVAGRSLSLHGDIPYGQGKLLEARKTYEEAISFGREIHDISMLTYPLRRLGYICLREGDTERAVELFGESLELNHEIGHSPGMGACLAGFAAADLKKKNLEKSAVLCGYVENLLERIGTPFFFTDTVEYESTVSELKKALAEKLFPAAWSKGRSLTLEQAVEFALKKT